MPLPHMLVDWPMVTKATLAVAQGARRQAWLTGRGYYLGGGPGGQERKGRARLLVRCGAASIRRQALARGLVARGIPTPNRGTNWQAAQVARIMAMATV